MKSVFGAGVLTSKIAIWSTISLPILALESIDKFGARQKICAKSSIKRRNREPQSPALVPNYGVRCRRILE